MAEEKLTPLMEQYFNIREQYPDTVLLFQVGDFYELFFEDAEVVSSFLAIALTKRGKCKGKDVPLCGVPIHALNHYLGKLVKGGFKVAICDQISEPKPGTVVERAVTRVLTPGTLTDSHLLDEKSASYLLAFYPLKDRWGLVFSELLTAQIFATTIPANAYKALEAELSRFFPDEIVIPDIEKNSSFYSYFKKQGYWVSNYNMSQEQLVANQWLETQFSSTVVKKLYEIPELTLGMQLLHDYLSHTQKQSLEQFKTIQFYQPEDYLYLDSATQRNLEIVKNNQDGLRKNTLLSVMDCAKTAMGSRMIKKWLTRPLLQKKTILQRQEVVGFLKENVDILQKLGEILGEISDLERIVGRVSLHKTLIQDYIALKQSLKMVPLFHQILNNPNFELLKNILSKFVDFSDLVTLLENSIQEGIGGNVIRAGFDPKLDRLRDLVENAQKAILALESQEVERTGIKSLKIRYNKVSGYSIEVTKANVDKVPEDYKRLQSLSNKERFVTQELLELQSEITRAQNEIGVVESTIFEQVKEKVYLRLYELRHCAYALAYLDGLYGFSYVAYNNNFSAPSFNEERIIEIKDGRHPVVEFGLQDGFIPNDTGLRDDESLWIITGPNMGGKSTYLRQVALICILAQSGSLVPASFATLPLLDRIFTRVGSGDNLAEGKSTFLVEMEETSVICQQATLNSLVILDEVGRGTSTFDGLAIARAVVEYIHKNIKARCLFATHYHELTNLKQHFGGIANYNMLSEKTDKGLLFLHKIAPGVAKGSFGIEVAKLAKMPACVISRAQDILSSLEGTSKRNNKSPNQKDLFVSYDDKALKEKIALLENELHRQETLVRAIKEVVLDDLTPRQAFELLWSLKQKR